MMSDNCFDLREMFGQKSEGRLRGRVGHGPMTRQLE